MGMITAFNELLSCLVTGLFGALFLLLFTKMGWLPMLIIAEEPKEEDDDLSIHR